MSWDTVVAMDWSGVPDRGARPKADAIWAAVIRDGCADPPIYLRSIIAAEAWIGGLLAAERAAGRSVLLGFDFPFGYPDGVSRAITGSDDPRVLWAYFADAFSALPGDEGRFDLAGRLNRHFPGEGPFWFNGLRREVPGLPRRKPAMPVGLGERRRVEALAIGAFAFRQMGGQGAVGSQAMTGMAALGRLTRRFGAELTVWPFDTDPGPLHVVEIWPSLFGREVAARLASDPDLPRDTTGRPIKDAAQVLVVAGIVGAAMDDGRLGRWLAAPPVAARQSEGWILGVEAADGASHPAPPPLSEDCFALPPGVEWTPVDTALGYLRDRLRPVTGRRDVTVEAADGCVLAEDVVALRSNPPGANSAVDGYGFAHAATGAGTQVLPLLPGRAAAGAPLDRAVPAGSAVRILTGALLPDGVDTVILEEDTGTDDRTIAFRGPVHKGANTRRAGEDVAAGDGVLAAGHVLRPPDLALLAATGHGRVGVRAPLRVGVLSTGDEIVPPGATGDPARTFDANRPMLLGLIRRWGHAAVDLGHVPDDRDRLRAVLDNAAADVILTSGGASAGEEDHVSALLRAEGALDCWRIALKPGRPLALGMRRGVPVFGLPGNPVASFVCALVFARPALSRMAGGPWCTPLAMSLPAAFEKRKKPGRREYLRARIGPDGVEAFASEGSGRISGLSWADGLVELPDAAARIRPGDPVRYLPYAGFGL